MTLATDSSTTLRPPWLHVARVAWVLLSVITVALFVLGGVNALREPLPTCTAPGADCSPWIVSREDMLEAPKFGLSSELANYLYFAFNFLPRFAVTFVAVIIFWRKSDDWVAMMLSLMLMIFIIEGVRSVGPLLPLANVVYAIATVLWVPFPFVFPDGHFVPRWTRWIVLPLTIFIPVVSQSYWLFIAAQLIYYPLAVYAVIYRYTRIASPSERQQIKWVMGGILGSFIAIVPSAIIAVWYAPTDPTPERTMFVLFVNAPLYSSVFLLVAITVAIAIFRYRLWAIDILIRRTLVYSVVSSLLALTYGGLVIILQSLFAALGTQSELATVISTLTIAALFFPLRNRVQIFIDRRFYRQKYDAAKTLAAFASTARDEVDLETLTARLVQVVDDTMQPERTIMFFKPMLPSGQKSNLVEPGGRWGDNS
jgi:hypothetical protein